MDYNGTLIIGDCIGRNFGSAYVNFVATLRENKGNSGYSTKASYGGYAKLEESYDSISYYTSGALVGQEPNGNEMDLSASTYLTAYLEEGIYEVYYNLDASVGGANHSDQENANFSDSFSSFIILHYQYHRITIEANSERIARCGVNPSCSSSRAICFF